MSDRRTLGQLVAALGFAAMRPDARSVTRLIAWRYQLTGYLDGGEWPTSTGRSTTGSCADVGADPEPASTPYHLRLHLVLIFLAQFGRPEIEKTGMTHGGRTGRAPTPSRYPSGISSIFATVLRPEPLELIRDRRNVLQCSSPAGDDVGTEHGQLPLVAAPSGPPALRQPPGAPTYSAVVASGVIDGRRVSSGYLPSPDHLQREAAPGHVGVRVTGRTTEIRTAPNCSLISPLAPCCRTRTTSESQGRAPPKRPIREKYSN
jgi:hypothetical protein